MSDWTYPLLPPNQTPVTAAIAKATDLPITPEIISTLWSSAHCPAALLPWLAWSLSVDEWDETWDESTQRRVIAASIGIHRKKGTLGAVRAALNSLGHRTRITEWWQTSPPGTPHTFQAEVEIDASGLDDTAVSTIDRQITATKPVRSHYTLRLIGRTQCCAYVGVVTQSGDEVTIQPYQITALDPQHQSIAISLGLHYWGPTTIYPLTH